MSTKVDSLRNTVVTMLIYYYNALIEDGCQDPKQEMATVLPSLIGLSEAQSEYVRKMVTDNDVLPLVDNLIDIMKWVVADTKSDYKSIKVMEGLQYIKEVLGGNINGFKQGETKSN